MNNPYNSRSYFSSTRWANWWHQIREVSRLNPKTVLEIGKGPGIVSESLQKFGVAVTTIDIDESLNPDVVASAEKMPFNDKQFDVVLAAEILEHLPKDKVGVALSEIVRVGKHAVISLPHYGSPVIFRLRIPKIIDTDFLIKIPFFWKGHRTTGDHYWVLGSKGCPRKFFREVAKKCGFVIRKEKIHSDDHVRIFFVGDCINAQ